MELNFICVNEILKNPDLYYAHSNRTNKTEDVDKNNEDWETLEEHTVLCQQYFQQIFEHKNMKELIQSFMNIYLGIIGKEAECLAKQMWCNVVTFHDVGKHNPNFQRNVLGRKDVKKNAIYASAGNGHSALSAVIYIDYYYKRIKKIGGQVGKRLCIPLVCNAYAIARHHSGLISLKDFIYALTEGNHKGMIEILQKEYSNICVEAFELKQRDIKKFSGLLNDIEQMQTKEQGIWLYFYEKLTYSMLVAADYYATSGFMSGVNIEKLGEIDSVSEFFQAHQNTKVNKAIRKYESKIYPMDLAQLKQEKQINVLRNEIFLDAEKQLLKQMDKNIFYLEAPTGSGKSNISINLSLQLAMADKRLKKIYYVYPFNTLVEQNQEILQSIFKNNPEILSNIAVINSVTPIKCVQEGRRKEETEETSGYYEKALLNRQFLNYPMILTTHVSFFDVVFGDSKESAFAFHQLAGSIVILDEIQSYKNSIWGEIIVFLTELAKFMHMKIIIMSATLPNLEILKEKSEHTGYLIQDRDKYFCHPCFKKRVEIRGELLQEVNDIEQLYWHVKNNCGNCKKILIEFITKTHAEEFYHMLKSDKEIEEKVFCMTGDDSIFERKKIIGEIKKENVPVILVSTQVVEAGVDIDMDIGYKNIAKMDSEEQFLGRINRSYSENRKGVVFFFRLDAPGKVYTNDIRSERELLITQPEIWDMLENKDFKSYYEKILRIWKNNHADLMEKDFFEEQVGKLDFYQVKKHMQLIDESRLNMSVYLGRKIFDETRGEMLDGNDLWEEYKGLLQNTTMGYAEKKIKLSGVMAKMNCFIYQIHQNIEVSYNDQIGELFYIADGEKYFEDGRLNRKMLQGQLGEYVDFI